MSEKQLYRTTVSFTVEVEADTEEQADRQLHNLIDQLAHTKTDLIWEDVEWEHEATIEYDTDYSGNLPKDEV
jgi:hypothetical protein